MLCLNKHIDILAAADNSYTPWTTKSDVDEDDQHDLVEVKSNVKCFKMTLHLTSVVRGFKEGAKYNI